MQWINEAADFNLKWGFSILWDSATNTSLGKISYVFFNFNGLIGFSKIQDSSWTFFELINWMDLLLLEI